MFTGIIEDLAVVHNVAKTGGVVRLVIQTKLDLSDTQLGDSIAVDGVCLTVTVLDGDLVSFDVGPESLRITALAGIARGRIVHLERAMALGGRLGGHLVQGHVDSIGTIANLRRHKDTLQMRIKANAALVRLCIKKGSITIDGVSLTINTLYDDGFDIWLIPHTLQRTHLGSKRLGDLVNLENDLIGKYVERLMQAHKPGGVTMELLTKNGFVI